MGDFMELGNSGLIPLPDGWFLDQETGSRVDPEGRIYDKQGELIHDPTKGMEDGEEE
ncbi:MAG TPA: hypothetical protein VJ742_11980 [Nitrososphaera sp.]|nr:hypothetical protein [Nitrososphaera sp.]